MFGLKADWSLDVHERYFTIGDYAGGEARWCPGCGDHGILTALQRICRDEQLAPEMSVMVSGIGCSSRFPHYMGTYGFHGLHGRALPIACGVKARRPELDVWVATGDGDCFSIGTAHWIHAIRYNMDMVVVVFDNGVYALTKKQTSPTSPFGFKSNTHPRGAVLPPQNPLTVTLGIENASFVAQTIDWNPVHLHATLSAAHKHKGLSFVRILQRCPVYSPSFMQAPQNDPSQILLLNHEQGVVVEKAVQRAFPNKREHDPSELSAAREIAATTSPIPIGLLYCNPHAIRYEELSSEGVDMSIADKLKALENVFDRLAV